MGAIDNLEDISEKINIVHEGQPEEALKGEIQKQITIADEVIFLGFSYDEENLKKLGILDTEVMKSTNVKRISGTTYGLTMREISEKEKILNRTGIAVELNRKGLTSLQYLRENVSFQQVN